MRLASSCTVIASGMTTSRTIFSCVGLKPCSWRCCFSRLRRAEASERSRSLSESSSALVTVRRPRRRSPPGAVLVRVGFGTSMRFGAVDRARRPGGRPREPSRGASAARRRGTASSPRRRRASSSAALARLFLGRPCAPPLRPGGARPRRARALSASRPRRRGGAPHLGLLALLGLADARFRERMGARVAFLVGEGAQHHAAARAAAAGAGRLDARGTRPEPPAASAPLLRPAWLGSFARSGRGAASSPRRRPSTGRRRSSGAPCRCRRFSESGLRPTRIVLSLLVVSLIHIVLRVARTESGRPAIRPPVIKMSRHIGCRIEAAVRPLP